MTKFQLGLVMGVAIWYLAETTWAVKGRMVLLPSLVVLLTFILSPTWVSTIINNVAPETSGSITLWRYFGFPVLILWLPVLLLPMSKSDRLMAIAITLPLASPYYQAVDLVALLSLPVGWVGLLSNISYGFVWWQYAIVRLTVIIPLLLYVILLGSILKKKFQRQNAPQ